MNKLYLVVFIVYVYNVICVSITPIEVIQNGTDSGVKSGPSGGPMMMDTIVYKTINKYICSLSNVADVHLIMYGHKAWTFPQQNVNLTLRYPSADMDYNSTVDNYLITGFEVVLFLDGNSTSGFITSGGIYQDSITLMFTSSQITKLQYRFWVFGVQNKMKISSNNTDASAIITMCT